MTEFVEEVTSVQILVVVRVDELLQFLVLGVDNSKEQQTSLLIDCHGRRWWSKTQIHQIIGAFYNTRYQMPSPSKVSISQMT